VALQCSLKRNQWADARAVNSEQIPFSGIATIRDIGFFVEWVMTVSKNDRHKEYAHYAAHCLEMVPSVLDQDFLAVQRRMAAEWLRLADAALHPAKANDIT
jgi:hypothetical protein